MEITLTLNRWMKVVDRINALIAERNERVINVASGVKLSFLERGKAETLAKNRHTEFERDYLEYQTLLDTLSVVRSKIGDTNVAVGVNKLMAEQIRRHRLIGLLETLSKDPHPSLLTPVVMATMPETSAAPANSLYTRPNAEQIYTLRILTDEEIAALRLRKERLKVEVNLAADQLAEKNATKLAIDITPEIATMLGLR